MRAIGGDWIDRRAAADVCDRAGGGAGRGRRDGWKFERETAAFAELAFDADATAVFFEDFLADGKAQAGAAAAFARDEDREDFFEVVFFDPAAVVDHGN